MIGKTVHISGYLNLRTRCGRPIDSWATPDDVVYYRVCQKCRRD